MKNPTDIIATEGRGAFFRPYGSGDYQPALYNFVQSIAVMDYLLEQGKNPYLKIVMDLGTSPEEYSPTGKFLKDRNSREEVIEDFRNMHSILYDSLSPLDKTQTNSALYRLIGVVRNGNEHDFSVEEYQLAKIYKENLIMILKKNGGKPFS